MTIESFFESAWNDHADQPREVADRLLASLHRVQELEHVAPYARLVTHVFGEHLGEWDRGVGLLQSMGRLPVFEEGHPSCVAVTRGIATLRYAGGDDSVLAPLSVEDRIATLAGAASAFTGHSLFARALASYSEALRLGESGLPAGSPAIRALAIGGNNLAAALEGKADRNSIETAGMVAAAAAALRYWRQAGTWLEEERAEYRLARSQLQAGEVAGAIQSARRCIEICERNDAPAMERFFGHAALAMAFRASRDAGSFEDARANASRQLNLVSQEDRQCCERDRNALGL